MKNIAYVARRSDVPDLNTALLLVNTQAVRRLVNSKNRYSRQRFITRDDWLQVKEFTRSQPRGCSSKFFVTLEDAHPYFEEEHITYTEDIV